MDARVKTEPNDAGTASALALARVLIACVVPILEGAGSQNAQAILNTIAVLAPRSDLRRLQALAHYRSGQYVEAMRCWNEFDDMSARALSTLCLRAIGEASWWGAAQAIYESGDSAAIDILEPWMNETPAAKPSAGASDTTCADSVSYSYRPLRA